MLYVFYLNTWRILRHRLILEHFPFSHHANAFASLDDKSIVLVESLQDVLLVMRFPIGKPITQFMICNIYGYTWCFY